MVNSPRLWDNRRQPSYSIRRAFAVYICALIMLLAISLLGAELRNDYQLSAAASQPNVAETIPEGAQNLDQFLPEQNNPSVALLQKLATVPPAPVKDCATTACIALTFDDGPDPASTPQILEVLNRERIRATFFLIGNRVAASAPIVRQMAMSGQEIGNHSWSHPNLKRLDSAQIQQQVIQTQQAIVSAGAPEPHMFRPPYGLFNAAMVPYINMPIIMWNVDPKDWGQQDPVAVAQAVVSQAKPGAIIVLHDKPSTAAALEKIIHDLRDRYQFVTVGKLLNLGPLSQGEFAGR